MRQSGVRLRQSHGAGWSRHCVGIFFVLTHFFCTPVRGGDLPEGFVYLRDIAPSILQDMRYATSDNFTGKRVAGYSSDECVLARPVAKALADVQLDLLSQALSLKVYDCYRPDRAVKDFLRWARTPETDQRSNSYHPDMSKEQVVARGYVAPRSTHSTGRAVDLTIVQGERAKDIASSPRSVGTCIAPVDERPSDTGVDMGTGFDCFHVRSHTNHPSIKGEARRWRKKLVAVMRKHGFHNYAKEWWHFNYRTPGFRKRRDFVVPDRRKSAQPAAKNGVPD